MPASEPTIWGVDSVSPLQTTCSTGLSGLPAGATLFEHVCNFVQPPAFWGRYLNSRRSALNTNEMDALERLVQRLRSAGTVDHNYRCRILPIYNQCARRPSRLRGRFARRNGLHAARDAVARAQLAHIPAGVCIYADVELYRVDRAWFEGWFEGMYASQYHGVGGIYGNAKIRHFRSRSGRVQGWRENIDDAFHAFEQQADTMWTFYPSIATLERPWSVDPRTQDVRPKVLETLIYTNRSDGRRSYIQAGGDMPRGHEIPTMFEGSSPEGLPATNTVIWQYAGNMQLGTRQHMVDYNLAKQKGYDVMWNPD